MDSQIFSCHGCDRLRFSEGFRARRLEPVGSGMELSGSTGSIEYYMPYFRKQNIVFFFVLRCATSQHAFQFLRPCS